MKQSRVSKLKSDFNLNGITEVYFWKSEWETFDPHDHDTPVSLYYFAYRFFHMAWFVGTYTQTFVCNGDVNFYGLYLTNQTYTLQVAYSVLFFLFMSWAFWRKRRSPNPLITDIKLVKSDDPELQSFHSENYQLPIVCKLLWIIINTLNVIPWVVSVIYWLFLYNPSKESATCDVLVNLFVHALNSPLVLLDMFVMAVPIKRTHAIFPSLFAVYYTVFSGLYELFNGRYNAAGDKEYIYPMLDWKNHPGFASLTCIGAIIGSFIIHFVMSYCIYRLRLYIKSKCLKNTYTVK